ncbi:MAG TPA: alpha/beta fold hydrolase [Microthrixaceae bacterium]|nr:alpha/beta fold hydrolase [Microthrixaceae bacterium]
MSASPDDERITWLRHHRIDLALHRLSDGEDPTARPLLLLHGLGERTPDRVPDHINWPGPVYGLDFTGHGRSTVPVGGGYTCEILVGDVDAALDHLGQVTILGRGLGAYIALLTNAARPAQVVGAVLADGPGLVGGGIHPGSPSAPYPAPGSVSPPDPFALIELSRDVRPPDYAQTFVRFVTERSGLERPLIVSAVVRPEWVEAIIGQPGVGQEPLDVALELFATQGDIA